MDKRSIENAKIESTMLGFNEMGIFTCHLDLNYEGYGQGFGSHVLAAKNESKDTSIPINYGANYIKKLLEAVGVEKWENLKGKYVRVDHSWNKIYRIGHIIKDKWFDPEDFFK